MTESTGDAHLRSVEVPDFLTVEEAARVLRIGRAAVLVGDSDRGAQEPSGEVEQHGNGLANLRERSTTDKPASVHFATDADEPMFVRMLLDILGRTA